MKKYYKFLGILIAVLISVLVFIFKDKFLSLQGLGLFGIFVISIIGNATIIFPVPVVLTAFIGGAVFNPIIVTITVASGAAIGELTGYLAGYGGNELIKDNKNFQKVKFWMDKYGLWTLFFLAAIPNPLFDVAGIIAGATHIPVYKYLPVVFLGKIIKFGIFAFLGAGIYEKIF